MKKVLVINNKYKIKGGEDSNIIDEINLLKNKNGRLVSLNEVFNDIQNINVYNLNKQKLMPFNET